MTFEIWLAFILAAGVVLVVPGPTIISVVSFSLSHGRKAFLPIITGVLLGDLTCMSLSLLGLGAVLAASAMLFSVVKILGAIYLIYLGVKLWCSDPFADSSKTGESMIPKVSLVRCLYITTATNPKGIVFFIAFFPQFINSKAAVLPQMLLLCATFLCLAAINATLYSLFAGQIRESVRTPRVRRWFNRCGGTALIGAGLLTATVRRAA
jgi:threonine/homoserine/homoserine lactone efflux protein